MNRGEESSNRRAVVETMDTEVRREESSNLRAVLKTMDTVVRGEENIFGYRSQGRLILKPYIESNQLVQLLCCSRKDLPDLNSCRSLSFHLICFDSNRTSILRIVFVIGANFIGISTLLLQGQKKAPHHTKALHTTSFLKQKSRNMFLTTDVGGKSWKLFHPTDVMNIHKISKPIASHLAMLLATTSIWVASYKKGLNYLY